MNTATSWSDRVLAWHAQHGRADLPWQHPRSPYRVWVSEIMLQQTTVAAVIPYFERFMSVLPDVAALAAASHDQVMALWSGLGYYARARNLHAAAKQLVADYDAELPDGLEALQALPGIGRSTAGAILAQAFAQPAPVLDGNVKRVLARHAGIAGWPGQAAVLRQLWAVADRRLPSENAVDYAQGMMDLGALLCTRRQPACEKCPVSSDCIARLQRRIDELPGRKPRKSRPVRHARLVIQRDEKGRLLLERRPPAGIWGGLWSLPELVDEEQAVAVGEPIKHEFSHFTLFLQPVVAAGPPQIAESGVYDWHTIERALDLGLPQPIRKLIEIHCR